MNDKLKNATKPTLFFVVALAPLPGGTSGDFRGKHIDKLNMYVFNLYLPMPIVNFLDVNTSFASVLSHTYLISA